MKLLSVVIPIFNEERAIAELHNRLVKTLRTLQVPFEIIFVDDGSLDGTYAELQKLSPIIALRLRRNYGQSQALRAGIERAQGDVIALMDGDLENHPEDLPLLIDKLREGHDVVSGWRKDRWPNQRIVRHFPSVLANKLISWVAGIQIHDHGCTLKVYRSDVLKELVLKGEEHRLLTAYAAINGARITEVPVRYTPRAHGKSKYGILRTFKVLVDVLALLFFYRYANRPMHFFGALGFVSFFFAFLSFIGMLYFKFVMGASFILTPLPVLTALFTIVGIQFILMGLLAEIFVRKIGDVAATRTIFVKEETVNS
ncbi:MAG TPA: glycosyltransferase family 2 protein [Candidatus Paceibacterota bacterium]